MAKAIPSSLALALCALVGTATAQQAAPDSPAVPTAIKAGVSSLSPASAAEITVADSPIAGLKEVRADGQVLYMSEDGKWLFAGDVINVQSRVNITDRARAEIRADVLKASDKSEHIIYGEPGNPKTLYVFTDTSCPYCTRFHKEIPKLLEAGITVEYLAWPRGGPKGQGFATMQGVWCAPDRKAALDRAFEDGKVAPATCSTPLRKHYELGASIDVQGTPAIYDAKGNHLGGYVPAARLIASLNPPAPAATPVPVAASAGSTLKAAKSP